MLWYLMIFIKLNTYLTFKILNDNIKIKLL